MPGCKCCRSPHRVFIEESFARGMSTRDISKELADRYGVSISHASIARHMKNHYLPKVQETNDPLGFLDQLGRPRLKRAIHKGRRILKTRHRCTCENPTSFKRRGVAYICTECGGWFPADQALRIKRSLKKKRKKEFQVYVKTARPHKHW